MLRAQLVLVFPLHVSIKEGNLLKPSARGFSAVFSENPQVPTSSFKLPAFFFPMLHKISLPVNRVNK